MRWIVLSGLAAFWLIHFGYELGWGLFTTLSVLAWGAIVAAVAATFARDQ